MPSAGNDLGGGAAAAGCRSKATRPRSAGSSRPTGASCSPAYRILGSIHDAEHALQDALLRAWRGLARFEGRSTLRSSLYTITTNTSLKLISNDPSGSADRLRPRSRSPRAGAAGRRIGVDGALRRRHFGLQAAGRPGRPLQQRESVELAFIAALQHLPANQRAVLILRDVLGFSAEDSPEALETTSPPPTAPCSAPAPRSRSACPSRASRPRCGPSATSASTSSSTAT